MRTGSYTWIGLALSGAAAVSAIEPSQIFLIQKGPVALKPQLELTETFDDNITFREEDRRSDFKTIVSPGIDFQLGSKTFNHVNLIYFYDRVEYLDNTELNANQHRVELTSRFEKRRFLLEGRDSFDHLSSPLGGGISIAGIRVTRDFWEDVYRLTYELSDKTSIYAEAVHSSQDYESGVPLYDSRTLRGTLGFEYKALSKTSFFGEVYYGTTENDKNVGTMFEYPTAQFVGMFLGARGNFTEKMVGMVKAGYEYRWYDRNSESSGAPVVEATITERFTENTSLTLGYSRRQAESVQFVASQYTLDIFSATVLQNLGADGRMRLQLGGSYIAATYDRSEAFSNRDRNDHIVALGLTFMYDIKLWCRAFARYDFEFLDSSEPGVIDYTVNRMTLGLQLGY